MISINTLNYIDIKRAFRIRCIMLILDKLNLFILEIDFFKSDPSMNKF